MKRLTLAVVRARVWAAFSLRWLLLFVPCGLAPSQLPPARLQAKACPGAPPAGQVALCLHPRAGKPGWELYNCDAKQRVPHISATP